MQALNVARQRLDILVAELGGDVAHDHRVTIIAALAFAEGGQLLGNILCVLATQVRIASRGDATAVR